MGLECSYGWTEAFAEGQVPGRQERKYRGETSRSTWDLCTETDKTAKKL